MRQQGALGDRPQARVDVVVGQGQPLVGGAVGVGLHDGGDFGFPAQAVRLEVRNRPQCIGQRMAVRRQNELHAKCGAGVMQQVQRIQVIPHVAIGRVNHGRAAVQDVVTRKQQPVFFEQQANMVGCVARCVDGLQCVYGCIALRRGQDQALTMCKRCVGHEVAIGACRGR